LAVEAVIGEPVSGISLIRGKIQGICRVPAVRTTISRALVVGIQRLRSGIP